MRTILLSSLLVLAAAPPALSAERVTQGGELICFKRDALTAFVKLLRERGPTAAQSMPGCIAAVPGLVLTSRGSAGQIEGAGPVTRIQAVSKERRQTFEGFTTARF
jgi:hypothetical protein